ncbi:hypothetical protein F5Y19DRAFT_469421 [Xylariaceae sp. FL1651]|nr:hypothetical protein F5Y19DRAFT_469421 [Xylariaceae sp. FL1651]
MQFFSSLILGLSLIAGTQAQPGVGVAHLVFHGGPASYDLYVPLDGRAVATNNGISVNIIDTFYYDALSLCTFTTLKPVALVGSVNPDGTKEIAVGPPMPILSVNCRAK